MLILTAIALSSELPSLETQRELLTERIAAGDTPPEDSRFQVAHQIDTDVEGLIISDAMTCRATAWDPLTLDCSLVFEGLAPIGVRWKGLPVHIEGQSFVFPNLVAAEGTLTTRYENGLLLKVIGGSEMDPPPGLMSGSTHTLDEAFGGLQTPPEGIGTKAEKGPTGTVSGSGSTAPTELYEAVAPTMNRNMSQLRYCYESRMRAHPGLQGDYSTTLTIAEGIVRNPVEVEGANADLRKCIEAKLRRWKFAADVTATATWTWTFQPE